MTYNRFAFKLSICFILSYGNVFAQKDNNVKPSFDCTKAMSVIEKEICSLPELSRLDSELGKSYKFLRKTKLVDVLNGVGDKIGTSELQELDILVIKKLQRKWIKQRNKCQTSENISKCLIRSYKSRNNDLRLIKQGKLKLASVIIENTQLNRDYSTTLVIRDNADLKKKVAWVISPEAPSFTFVEEHLGENFGVSYFESDSCINVLNPEVVCERIITDLVLLK